MPVNHRRTIRFAEYAAVSMSLIGAIATITTRQPAYAVAPLSVSAALSLVSRRQKSQQNDLSTASVVQQAKTETTQAINTIRSNIREHQQLISARLATLERSQSTNDLTDDLNQVRSEVTQTLHDVQTALDALSAQTSITTKQQNSDITQINQRVGSQLANIPEQVTQLKTKLENRIAHLSQYVTQTKQSFESQQSDGLQQTAQLENRVVTLRGQVESLRTDLDSLLLQGQQLSVQPIEKVDAKPAEAEITPDFHGEFDGIIPQLPVGDDFDGDINLGIDFGTGYTKVCFRDLARESSEVVTFSSPTSERLALEETLMPTRIAILQDGTLLTGLTEDEWAHNNKPIETQIDYIKMRLAALDVLEDNQNDEWRLEQVPELDDVQTVESLCAYYLSRVIERSQQWIAENRPELFASQDVRWSVNIGVPVEYCDSPALKRFEKVLALAWLLKSTDVDTSSLTIDKLNRLIVHLQQWMDHNKTLDELDCTTTPEIVAAMWSFINSRQAQEGFYTFFDIGDGTLDGAAFIFNRAGGERQVDCYIGKVEPLGVSAFVEKTASELKLSTQDVRESLSDASDSEVYAQMQQSATRRKVQVMVAQVVMGGNEKHSQIREFCVEKDIGEHLKVFVGGGGSNTALFPQTIQATHGDFQHSNSDIPPYEIRQIPTPADLVVNGLSEKDFNRFAIAYGLCIPEGEGPEIRLPSQFETIESGSEITGHDPENYEDGKDAM